MSLRTFIASFGIACVATIQKQNSESNCSSSQPKWSNSYCFAMRRHRRAKSKARRFFTQRYFVPAEFVTRYPLAHRRHTSSIDPGRIVTNVLPVSARKVSHPLRIVVRVKANDRLTHENSSFSKHAA